MKTLNKLRWSGACLGLCLAGAMLWSRTASAEVTLLDADGWTFSFDGRINSFMSGGQGDDFPLPTPGSTHVVMGHSSQAATGIPDVGWPGAYQQDKNNKYKAIRVRSGMFGNVLGFGIARQVSETLTIKGYVALWSTVETLARDKWAPITAEARLGYFTAAGPWGSFTVGRMLGWLGRTSYDIDVAYGHGYGVGLPCTDALGPACGHIGTGALFPGYSAGISYSTPVAGGLQLNFGVYDPVVFGSAASEWSRAPYPREEGSLTFVKPFGDMGASFKLGVEGLFQQVGRIVTTTDPMTNAMSSRDVTTNIWGVSGGARVEAGPLRLGISGFRGHGTGLGMALQRSVAIEDNDGQGGAAPTGLTYGLRDFSGFYGQIGAVLHKLQVGAGYGMGIVDQLAIDKQNPNLSVIHSQTGISAAVYYHLTDSVVLAADYFHYKASWYGAPLADANGVVIPGMKLAGELQNLDFLNVGVTYHW